ncbi:MAG: DUF4261 domain-containing protein [Verrucomicrobiota bacterium]
MSEECVPEPSIVLGIPGNWKDRSEIVTSIVSRSGGYMFAGKILMHTESQTHFELDVYENDPALPDAVRSGGRGQIPEEDLAALKDHTFTLYLLSDETGPEVVGRMMDAAVGLLDAGGLVVKVETAGFSVGAAQWREYATNKCAYNMYRSMVTLVGEGEEHFTCGMKAFSLPDCSVQANLDEAFNVSTEFCCYTIDEAPQFAEGHTFSVAEEAQKYRISFDNYTFYPPGNLFHNPNGLWRLSPI